MMVHETTCGLSFQLKKGGIDDGIGCQIKVSTTTTSSMPDGHEIFQMGNCGL
jgi:hypothetical protein